MNKSEIRTIEETLRGLGNKKDKIHILEWGSGGSTVYFTEFLKEIGVPYEWISIEYNKRWHEKVKNAVAHDPNIEVVLFDVGNDQLKQVDNPMDEYVGYPTTLDNKFDMVLVDGRKRRRCVLEAKKNLAPEGVVFLHDAQRKYYHCALGTFPNRRFVAMFLWQGKLTQPSLREKVVNILYTSLYRFLYIVFVAPFRWVKRLLLPWRKKRAKARARSIATH